MKRATVVDIVVMLSVALFVALTLVPAIARMQRTPIEAKCQSNMRRWAEAMALYCADFQGRFPTNRPILANGALAVILPTVLLSPPDPIPPATEPPKFLYSVNWVEALYPYLQSAAEKTGQDWKSFWRCPAASSKTLPTVKGPQYLVTYVLNRCLVEKWSQLVREPKNLMMMRELGRLTIAALRPANDSTGNSMSRPIDAFMIARDAILWGEFFAPSEYLMHANGSHVMFADGHVKAFDISYFSTNPPTYTTQATAYYSYTEQWHNYSYANPTTPDQEAKNRSIAISP